MRGVRGRFRMPRITASAMQYGLNINKQILKKCGWRRFGLSGVNIYQACGLNTKTVSRGVPTLRHRYISKTIMRKFIIIIAGVIVSLALMAAARQGAPKTDMFEQTVEIIKKYETLHKPRHWPLVGYGHKVLPGEKYSRKKALTEKEADALLRKDLRKLCRIYRSYGKDSLLLAALAYNIGHGAVNRSSVVKKLKAGNRDIRSSYISHCRYRGKEHAQIKRRRTEEFEKLFIP